MYADWQYRRHGHGHHHGGWIVFPAIILAVIVLGHIGMMLIPIVAIVAGTALLWGPTTALARRVGSPRPTVQPSPQLDARITILESQLQSLTREHQLLQETVRWQERLLQHTTGAAQPFPPSSQPKA